MIPRSRTALQRIRLRKARWTTQDDRVQRRRGRSAHIGECWSLKLGFLFVALACVIIAGSSCGGAKKTPQPTRVNAGYVEFVSVARGEDQTHCIPIQDADGTTWYRERLAGFDLAQLRYEMAAVDQMVDGTWGINVPVRDAVSKLQLKQWSKERIGTKVGVVLDGRLVYVVKITTAIRSGIAICGFLTKEDALAEAAVIRAGGVKSPSATQPVP